jgi:hypothetical protein
MVNMKANGIFEIQKFAFGKYVAVNGNSKKKVKLSP